MCCGCHELRNIVFVGKYYTETSCVMVPICNTNNGTCMFPMDYMSCVVLMRINSVFLLSIRQILLWNWIRPIYRWLWQLNRFIWPIWPNNFSRSGNTMGVMIEVSAILFGYCVTIELFLSLRRVSPLTMAGLTWWNIQGHIFWRHEEIHVV